MPLITPAFFIADINIPNIGNTKVDERINAYLSYLEPQCLELILGKSLYASFLSDSTTQRMLELKSGVDYTVNNVQYHWRGLVETNNISLIAYYSYFYIMRDMATITTGTGEKVVVQEDTKIVSPSDKMVNSYNKFSRRVKDLSSFLWNNATYPEVNWYHLSYLLDKTRPLNTFGL